MRRITEGKAATAGIMLGLLDAVEQDRTKSQRSLASNLGIALGLVNAYLKCCVEKGLIKIGDAPGRRHAYHLTPKGLAEKSRLTVEYLSSSFGFFRQAKMECSQLLRTSRAQARNSILLVGQSDLAEIAALCAMEQSIALVGLVQPEASQDYFIGLPIFPNFDTVTEPFYFLMITDMTNARATCEAAVARYGVHRVLVP